MIEDKDYLSPTQAIYSEGLRREELSSPISEGEESKLSSFPFANAQEDEEEETKEEEEEEEKEEEEKGGDWGETAE
ncbi:MAG: hypothetical protein Q8P08_00745 [bacterium]|nr:hypothetical protein [bacterium]